MKRNLCLLLLLSACKVIGLHAQGISEHYPEYRLQRSDVLDVKYRYTPEFDQTLSIGPDGRVSLVGFGTFVASGLTVDEFRHEVIDLSTKRLVKPEVTIVLKEFEKPHVYVEGEVNTPGRVEFRSDITITDAIAMAGGFKNSGKQSQVLLLHRIDAETASTRVVDVKKLVASHQLEEATELHPGDVIYVPQNNLSKVERLVHLGQFGAIYSPLR
jgi:polysaccharide export outer membrane protein